MNDRNPAEGGMPPVGVPRAPDPSENLLRHYAGIIRRRWRWVGLGLLVGLLAGVLAAVSIDDEPDTATYFKATNTLTLGDLDNEGAAGNQTVGEYTLNQAALLIQSQQLKEQVARTTGLTTDQVAERVEATVRPNVNAIDVTAIATDGTEAVELADRSADVLRIMAQAQAGDDVAAERVTLESELEQTRQRRSDLQDVAEGDDEAQQRARQQEIQDLTDHIRGLEQQLQNLPDDGGGFSLSVLAPATPTRINARGYQYRRTQNINARNQLVDTSRNTASTPDFDELDLSTETPITPRTRILLGGAAGLVLGLITAFVVEAWDDRVRRRDQVERLTGLGVLADVPQLGREQVRAHHVAVVDAPTGVAAERYRSVRTAIEFIMSENDTDHCPVIMITSPGPAEGKTTTAVNLAATFADTGKRVLVVDGDFRRPAVRRYLTPTPNLVAADEPQQTRVGSVDFLPGPTDAPTPEAAIEAVNGLVTRWRDAYDLVVLDTPPILTTNDAVGLLASAQTVLLVLRSGRTRPRAAARVAELLRQYRTDTLGVVLNSVERAEMNEYYGYGDGYGYGYLGRTGSRREESIH